VSPVEDQNTINEGCRTAGIGCVDCKRILHKNLDVMLDPIRQRNDGLTEAHIDEALVAGAERVRTRIRKTTEMVKEKMGL
jgi:tryptophanyl-tRNA synthetase